MKSVDSELLDHLDEQIEFLRASAKSFDCGAESEAKRLAVTIRVLLHDTTKSHSLLQQLGLKPNMPLVHSGRPLPRGPKRNRIQNLDGGLCRLGPEGKYVPFLGDFPPDRDHPPQCFLDWWHREVFTDGEGAEFSRRKYVLNVANKDGGAHVAPKLPKDFEHLTRENSAGFLNNSKGSGSFGVSFSQVGGDEGEPFSNSLVLASIRQMAWELLESIERWVVIDHSIGAVGLRKGICGMPFAAGLTTNRNSSCPCGSGRASKECYLLKQPPNAPTGMSQILRHERPRGCGCPPEPWNWYKKRPPRPDEVVEGPDGFMIKFSVGGSEFVMGTHG